MFGPAAESQRAGYAVGDEPQAVKAGADVLAQGGSAADAATAMYFALAVTYPGAAGLGGGGICLAYDADSHSAQAIDFLARNASGGGVFAVPGNVRGFATLQANFGKLPWQRDVSYGEALAATGFQISASLATRLNAAQNVVRLDAGLAAEFLDVSGQVKAAGTTVRNGDLAATLAAIRQHRALGFYSGDVADKIATYAAAQGGSITTADLNAYAAHMRAPQLVTMDSKRLYLPPSGIGAGSFAAAVMSHMVQADGTPVAGDPAAVTRAAVAAALKTLGMHDLPSDLGATGFAALDKDGQGVACAVTMNGPFGSGHTAKGTGVTLANAPSAGPQGSATAFLTPMLLARNVTGPIRLPDEEPTFVVTLAGAGAGGPNGMEAVAYTAMRQAHDEDTTRPGNLIFDVAAPYDTVNAITCQYGTCAVLPHTRAHGLGRAGRRLEHIFKNRLRPVRACAGRTRAGAHCAHAQIESFGWRVRNDFDRFDTLRTSGVTHVIE